MSTPDPNDASALEGDLERTRAELGHTVEQLKDKLDVKTRVRDGVGEARHAAIGQAHRVEQRAASVASDVKGAATDDRGKPKPAVTAGGVAFVVVVGAVIWWVWRRK